MIFFLPAGMTTVFFTSSNTQPNTLAIRAPCMWEIPYHCSDERLSKEDGSQ